jgi:hypothetical protein
MIVLGGLQDCAEVGGLLGRERDRAPDLSEVLATIAPGDHGLGAADAGQGIPLPDL